MRRAAVVGMGQTKHVSARHDVNMAGLVREAAQRALDDAGLTYQDIDAVVIGSAPDLFEGVAFPERWFAGALGAFGKPILRIHTMGSVGGSTAISAFYHVASGVFDKVLAVAFEKQSEAQTTWVFSAGSAGRSFSTGAGGAFAPVCRFYIDRWKVPPEMGPRVAVKDRNNALRNPYAHWQKGAVTLEDVMNSPMLWDPFRRLESCPTSDGAAAMVFAAEELAPKLHRKPVWVKAAVGVTEAITMSMGMRTRPPAEVECAKRAYADAGITNPRKDLQMAEIYTPFSWIEFIHYEALGFCDEGQGWRLLDEGVTEFGGSFPVDPSGGVIATNPIGAAGMLRMLEAALQVQGTAEGGHQVPDVRQAMGHAYGGSINYHAIMIFSDTKP
jgi:acetyl-CoA C-acetyltransferase